MLGYPDNTGAVATTPAFDGLDLGKNGSYLVLRQLEQDVRGFWIEWLGHAGGDPEVAVWLASKALGRWPNGMPINGRARSSIRKRRVWLRTSGGLPSMSRVD